MLSGAIKESHLARVRRGLTLIQKGEGGDKGGDNSLYFGGRLKVEEGCATGDARHPLPTSPLYL